MPSGIYKRTIKHKRLIKLGISKSTTRFSWLGKKRAPRSKEWKINIGLGNKGKIRTEEMKEKIRKSSPKKRPWRKGIPQSEETKRKIKETWKTNGLKGNKSPNWKGGLSTESHRIRAGSRFREWRGAVFSRDNYTCQKFRIRGFALHPHHILNFSQYPELRFVINNGITLSEKAHKEFHKKYGYKNNNKEQIKEFIGLDKFSRFVNIK